MKFEYEYRTSDNVPHRGTITASTKEAAYDALKAQGIKPGKVWEAPGFFNKLFGKGKRWIAIAVLCALCLVISVVSYFALHEAQTSLQQAKNTILEASLFEDRAQLFGDPVVIRECEEAGWTNAFTRVFDVYLAQYAIPGRNVDPLVVAPPSVEEAIQFVEIGEKDLAEIAQMKRMVNGMKLELKDYLAAGGSIGAYMKRLSIRQRAERGVFETAQRAILRSRDHATWKEKNAELRAMGLPMVELPEGE